MKVFRSGMGELFKLSKVHNFRSALLVGENKQELARLVFANGLAFIRWGDGKDSVHGILFGPEEMAEVEEWEIMEACATVPCGLGRVARSLAI